MFKLMVKVYRIQRMQAQSETNFKIEITKTQCSKLTQSKDQNYQ